MTTEELISALPEERKEVFSKLRAIILKADKNVDESVESTMGHEMLVYKTRNVGGTFKYALANQKGHISLHNMILYGHHKLREKYELLMLKIKFQKACLNFKNMETVPFDLIENLMNETAKCSFPPVMAKK